MNCPQCGMPLESIESVCPQCMFGIEPASPLLAIAGFLLAVLPVVVGGIFLFSPGKSNSALNLLSIAMVLLPAFWLVLHFALRGPARSFGRGLGYGLLAAFGSMIAFAIIGAFLAVLGLFTICSKLPGGGG